MFSKRSLLLMRCRGTSNHGYPGETGKQSVQIDGLVVIHQWGVRS